MKKKLYKYEQKKEKIKSIFKKPEEGNFIIVSQLNSLSSSKFDMLKKFGIANKIMIEFLNLKKMKSVFEQDQELLLRLTNEIVVIKGNNYATEFGEILKFLEKEEIKTGLLLLTILIEEHGKYREMPIESFKKKGITVNDKKEAMINLYKILKGKLMGMSIKLVGILKKKEEK